MYTHVGRQAVSLCDRLGGSRENASTIHSAHHRRQKKILEASLRVKYAERIELLVVDEVYNCDDHTMEMVLSLAHNARRVVLIGDPDQIMPISGEEGAGTPAADIAKAFPGHVIVLNENMRQQESARAIHDVVTNVRLKQPRAISWSSPTGALLRVDPPQSNTVEALASVLNPMIKRLRQGIGRDEHAWQLVTFYNGFKPEQQGLGVRQLNDLVEKYMEINEPGRKKGAFKINKRLTMYPGFKFMITEKFKPHKSLRPAGMNKKKPAAQANIRKKLEAGDGDTMYSETANGQIEVVKYIRVTRVKNSSAESWIVDCEPKGRCVKGARLLINRRLHVDPSGISPAWAITSNKSMGGECKNVGVYIPTTIGKSRFDRSSLYVAVSRPIEWLGVIGRVQDIATMVMRDPRPVNTGLFLRLRTASVTPPGSEELGWDWKDPHDYTVHGMLNDDLLSQFDDICDQSKRQPYARPTPICSVSWRSFLASEELLLKGNAAALKALAEYVKSVNAQLYGHVPDHSPKLPVPWERPGDIPRLPPVTPAPVTPSPVPSLIMGQGATVGMPIRAAVGVPIRAKRAPPRPQVQHTAVEDDDPDMDEDEDEDEEFPVAEPGVEPEVKRARQDESESL